jgi:hypothetical protein
MPYAIAAMPLQSASGTSETTCSTGKGSKLRPPPCYMRSPAAAACRLPPAACRLPPAAAAAARGPPSAPRSPRSPLPRALRTAAFSKAVRRGAGVCVGNTGNPPRFVLRLARAIAEKSSKPACPRRCRQRGGSTQSRHHSLTENLLPSTLPCGDIARPPLLDATTSPLRLHLSTSCGLPVLWRGRSSRQYTSHSEQCWHP